jgi:hypothetical protein
VALLVFGFGTGVDGHDEGFADHGFLRGTSVEEI